MLVALAATLLLAACGGGSSNDNKSSATGASDSASTTAQDSGSASGEKVTLHSIFLGADWGKAVKDVLGPEYEKQTGVKIEVDLIGRDAIHSKMATLFAAKDDSFDIFNLDYNWIPEFGGAGQLADMSDMLSAEDRQDFFPLALKVATYNDKLYGIPQTIHPAILWYRKDLYGSPAVKKQYQAATGQALSPPKTMDEWKTQVKFFNGKTFKGKKTYGWAAQAAKGFGNVHTWLSFLYTYGGQPFNGDFTKSTLSTPQATQATQQWAEMMKYMPPGANGFTFDNVTAAAQQGTIATALQWSWGAFATDDTKNSRTVGDWDYTTIPVAAEGQPSHAHLAEWVISVSKYSKHVDEAKKFAAWLETKKNDVLQASLGGGDPVRQSSYDDPTLTEAKVKGTDVMRFRRFPVVLETMKTAMPRPFFPNEERWETTVSSPLQAIQLGQMPAPQGLSDADKAVDGSLSR
jgi:ABC-type glycerol-3-phosphate transport system substrate-binding protein